MKQPSYVGFEPDKYAWKKDVDYRANKKTLLEQTWRRSFFTWDTQDQDATLITATEKSGQKKQVNGKSYHKNLTL